jgi:DNA ligase-1
MSVLLAKTYDPAKNQVGGFFASEKLDGVRAYWDAANRQLLTRNGKQIHAPDWWLAALPAYDLDGELTMGRGRFQDTVSAVRCTEPDERWDDVQYRVFDAPTHPGAFRARLAFLWRGHRASYPTIEDPDDKSLVWDVVPHYVVSSVDTDLHLRTLLEEIEFAGGEGIMLRDPGSRYERKRSNTLLKLKSMQDIDAVVIGYQPGKGQHEGRVGSLVCELTNGILFQCGTGMTVSDRESPPAVGSIVVIQYQEFTRAGLPRFPVFKGVRADVAAE